MKIDDLFKKAKSEVHAKIEPEEFKGNTLGGKFGNTLVRFFKKTINSTTDWFEERLINFAVGVLVKIETSGKSIFAPLIKELKAKEAIPDFLKPIFDEIEDPKHEAGAMLGASIGQSAIGGLMGAVFDPLMAEVKYGLNRIIKPYIPGLTEMVTGYRRGDVSEEALKSVLTAQGFDEKWLPLWIDLSRSTFDRRTIEEARLRDILPENLEHEYYKRLGFDDPDIERLKELRWKIIPVAEAISHHFRTGSSKEELYKQTAKNGISKELTDKFITVNRRILDFTDIKSIYYREDKDESWLNTQLDKLGLDEETRENIKKVMPYYPSVSDLVRFAVREVYYSDYVEKYGLMDEYPAEYEEASGKAGLDSEQAKNFWMSHWELPSILQGYEMLHRNVIGSEELGDLFKAVDIMPYWRERLEKISYRVYSRVDVRRMYRDGVLDEAGVLKAYEELGYDAEKAEKMTEFTIAFYAEKEKDLTRANIQDGYKREYFSDSEAIELLKLLGYTDEQADYYLSKVEYDKAADEKKKYLSLTEDEFKKGIKSENEAISILTEQGFKSTEIEYHLDSWKIDRKAKPETPSKADLKSWMAKKIITRDVFIEEMRNQGFADKYINYYLAELKQKGL